MATIAMGARRKRSIAGAAPTLSAIDLERDTRPLGIELVRWLFAYTRPYAAQRNTLLALVLLRSIQLPFVAWTMGQVISGPISGKSSTGLFWGVIGFLALTAFTHATFHFRQRLALALGEAVIHDLRNDVFAHLQKMRLGFFNETKLGRILTRVTSDAEAVRAGVQDVFFTSMVGLGQMIVAGLLMLWYDTVLFLVVGAMVPVLWSINHVFRRRLSKAHRDVHESFSRVTSKLAESVHGVHVTQGFVRQHKNTQLFRDLVSDHSKYNLEAARTAGFFLPLLEFNSQLFLATLLLLGGYRVMSPDVHMPVGDLIQFLFLANIFFQPIQTLGDQYNQALVSMAGAERVRELLDTPPQWTDAPTAKQLQPLQGQLTFENVSFGYRADRPVLHDICFTARPGETIALVGHTGSGKSSIVNLVAKFYLPNSGRVLLDGHDLRDVDSDCLHRQMGIVLQQNFLFSGTVMDNIRLGRLGATDDEVMAAVANLGCLELIDSLPEGLQTYVGESGSKLSLGQRQLVCFARAMLADPAILILDEATSSVDVFTERRIQQALGRLMRGRTSFVVAHRLSTIRDADQVLVLDQGQIVERGDHHSLLKAGGAYAALHDQFTRLNAA